MTTNHADSITTLPGEAADDRPTAGVPTDNNTTGLDAILADAGRSRRRTWPLVVAGAAAGAAIALAATTALDTDEQPVDVEDGATSLATAQVGQRDLIEEIEWAGTLGYGDPVAVTGPSGVVTVSAEPGTDVERGDTIAIVGDQPVVVFYGPAPLWRQLTAGDEGSDVRQIEANLAALGYDPDLTVDVDDEFTANTAAMVERWQTDLGLDPTGVIDPTDVVMVEGPSTIVSTTTAVGSAVAGTLATMAPRLAVTDVVATIDGTVTDLAPIGSDVMNGTILYDLDEVPVVALEPFDSVASALLDPTFTDLELEQALADGGHDIAGELTVDGIVTEATVDAFEAWQRASGLPVTGRAEPGWFVEAPDGHVVEAHGVTDGEALITGGPVVTTSRSRLSVSVVVDVAEADEFTVGQDVVIEAADDSVLDGRVDEIGAVVPAANPQDAATVTVTIGITGTDTSVVEGPVTVVSTGEEIPGATVVPVRALVALAEGGFAVERVANDGQTSLVAVEIGTFSDGLVELVAGDLEPGDEVVVPR